MRCKFTATKFGSRTEPWFSIANLEIHDTVLIAAALCMYNPYVDGLATYTPTDPRAYDEMGVRLAKQGYVGDPATADAAAR